HSWRRGEKFRRSLWCEPRRVGENAPGASSSSGRDRPAGRPGPEPRRSKNAARQPARSQMETFGIVLSMLAAVVLSGIVVRALPLGIPTPLVQIALGAVIAAASDYEVRLDPQRSEERRVGKRWR